MRQNDFCVTPLKTGGAGCLGLPAVLQNENGMPEFAASTEWEMTEDSPFLQVGFKKCGDRPRGEPSGSIRSSESVCLDRLSPFPKKSLSEPVTSLWTVAERWPICDCRGIPLLARLESLTRPSVGFCRLRSGCCVSEVTAMFSFPLPFRSLSFGICLVCLAGGSPCAMGEDPATPALPAGVTVEAAGSPESVLRQFMMAMVTGDKDTAKKLAQPNKEFDELLNMIPAPPADKVEQMKAVFQLIPITPLKVGEQFTLPNGQKVTVDTKMVTEKKQMLMFPGNPIPLTLVKDDSGWKVDTTPMVQARKAARKAMEKQMK